MTRHMVSSLTKPVNSDGTLPKPDPMTDAAMEAVARAFCTRMGLDPDHMAYWHERDCYDFWWSHYSQHAREAIAMHLALKEVLG